MPVDPAPDPALAPPPDGAKPVPDACPACGAAHCMHVIDRMLLRPPSDGAVAGRADKRLARPGPALVCWACGASAPLTVEPGGTHARLADPSAMRPRAT